eukprot:TRINITY_DN3339_c0_g1_i2.p1 TRINITY_DN3339_c0_g1~~TRINITY_DN3339_c0_g1_i2.p1  ORF type:complete len:241 (-),score=50.88 TRINITY_DN3339_c0_g1_i2:106-828(-)
MAVPQEKIVIHYFDIRGLAEYIRLILVESGVEYQEVRIDRDTWWGRNVVDDTKTKAHYQKAGMLPFDQLPVVQIGDSHFSQSMSIVRMLAKKYGLYGEDIISQYNNDMIADSTADFRAQYGPTVYADEETYPAKLKTLLEVTFPKHLSQWNAVLTERNAEVQRNDKGDYKGQVFFAGKNFGYCDLVMFEILDLCLRLDPHCLDKFPLLAAHHKSVSQRPKIAEYLGKGKRPEKANNSGRG